MPIQFSCNCGQTLEALESQAGKPARCSACGAVLQVPAAAVPVALNYAGGGGMPAGGPIAPPPGAFVRTPTEVPPKFRSPGKPPCYLSLSTQGASVNAQFDVSPVMDAFAEAFAKKLRKRYDVQIVNGPAPAAPFAYVQLVHVDEGNRFLRYFLTLFAGKTIFEIEGEYVSASGRREPIHLKHKGQGGFIGGAAINLLKGSGRYTATKIAKKVLK